MRDLLRTSVRLARIHWFWPLALLTLPNCTFSVAGLPSNFKYGDPPHSGAIFCDIEKEDGRHCPVSADEIATGIDLSEAAVALANGQTSGHALDYSPAGTTTVTWTATDAASNQTTATQHVTVTDTVAPTVACTLENPTGRSYRVTGSDACGALTLMLGGFAIASGELIKIDETGQAGVRLINDVSNDGIRHFQVGKGQGVIVATDGSNNVTTAICR